LTYGVLQISGDEIPGLPTHEQAAEHLARSQLVLDALLPPPADAPAGGAVPLLRIGAPSTETVFSPAMEIVKPGPRFGLLLVADAGV
jgi:hypothetical protein